MNDQSRAADLGSSALEESEVAQGLNILRAAEQTLGPDGHFVLQSMHRGGRHHHSADDATRSTSVPAPLHHRAKWGLGAYFSVLLHVHAAASWAGLESLAFTLSTQIGGVARELLLHKDSISYSFMVARKE